MPLAEFRTQIWNFAIGEPEALAQIHAAWQSRESRGSLAAIIIRRRTLDLTYLLLSKDARRPNHCSDGRTANVSLGGYGSRVAGSWIAGSWIDSPHMRVLQVREQR